MNRVVKQVDPDGSQNSFLYQDLTKISKNSKNQTKTETSNSLGLLISSKDDLNNTLTYKYDAFGKVTQITDPNGNATTITYDSLGNKISSSDKDSGSWSFTYNGAGELISSTDAKGSVTNVTYDNLGRMNTRTTIEGTTTWVYDTMSNGIGKLASVSTSGGHSKSYSYDSIGRATSVQTTMDTSYNISNTYDSYGRISKVTFPTGYAVKYKYDVNGFLTEINNANNDSLIWKVSKANADGAISSETFGNNLIANRSYDDLTGRLTEMALAPAGGSEVFNLALSYDSLGNVLSRTELINPSTNATISETYSYDNLNRLTTVSGPNPKSFAYDSLGNIVNKSDVGSYTYGTGSPGSPIHAVVSTTGVKNFSFTYDANGNMLTGNGRTMTWTSFNKPSAISNSSNTINYSYDGNFERYKETQTTCKNYHGAVSNSCTKYMINPAIGTGVHFEKEVVGSITVNRHYISAGPGNTVAIYATHSDGLPSMSYLHKDHLGTVNLITDATGSAVERFSFDAYGKRRNLNGSDDSNNSLRGNRIHQGFTFHQHLDDGSMGLIHMNGRLFDPLIGRFMAADPVISDPSDLQAFNRYSYLNNNPLNGIDPTGYFRIGGDIGKAFNAINNVAHNVLREVSSVANSIVSVTLDVGKTVVNTVDRNLPAVNKAIGIYLGIANPFVSVILMNTTTIFQDNFDFSKRDLRNFNTYYVALAAAGAGAVSGGMGASYLGFAGGTFGATLVGTAVGSVGGAVVGALGFPMLGLGTTEQGWAFGAAIGGIAGGLTGQYAEIGDTPFDPYQKNLFKDLNKKISDYMPKELNTYRNPLDNDDKYLYLLPWDSGLASTVTLLDPYIMGVGASGAVHYAASEVSQGRWPLPPRTWKWEW